MISYWRINSERPKNSKKLVVIFRETKPEDSEKSGNGTENLIKGGIEIGKDGYYHGNILSYPAENFESNYSS